jgi:hypothetical protein
MGDEWHHQGNEKERDNSDHCHEQEAIGVA